jgi:hypothetical protein
MERLGITHDPTDDFDRPTNFPSSLVTSCTVFGDPSGIAERRLGYSGSQPSPQGVHRPGGNPAYAPLVISCSTPAPCRKAAGSTV